MFCPVCSQQQQAGAETRFCSRCGFLLTGVSQLIASGGASHNFSSADPKLISPRKRGIKQGALLMLSALFFVPLSVIITLILQVEPFLVAIAFIVTIWGGILRMLYALIFESSQPSVDSQNILPEFLSQKMPARKNNVPPLPAARQYPINDYAPPFKSDWRETNDLAAPPSVTDQTTKFLRKE